MSFTGRENLPVFHFQQAVSNRFSRMRRFSCIVGMKFDFLEIFRQKP